MTHAFLGGGLDPGAIVVQVVEVKPVHYLVDTEFARLCLANREQIVLAQVASVERIAGVAGNLEFVGFDDQVARADQARHRERRVRGPRRASWAKSWSSASTRVAKHVVRDLEHEGGIDAAGERDDHAAASGANIARSRASLASSVFDHVHRYQPLLDSFGLEKIGRQIALAGVAENHDHDFALAKPPGDLRSARSSLRPTRYRPACPPRARDGASTGPRPRR